MFPGGKERNYGIFFQYTGSQVETQVVEFFCSNIIFVQMEQVVTITNRLFQCRQCIHYFYGTGVRMHKLKTRFFYTGHSLNWILLLLHWDLYVVEYSFNSKSQKQNRLFRKIVCFLFCGFMLAKFLFFKQYIDGLEKSCVKNFSLCGRLFLNTKDI